MRRLPFLLSLALLASFAGPIAAKDKHQSSPPQDQIDVVGHIPATAGETVSGFVLTQHYRRDYLYTTSTGRKAVVLIDVTDPSKPSLLANITGSVADGDVVTAAGTAALTTDSGATGTQPAKPQTFRIISFADPAHPVVRREFTDVSAVGRDDKRRLIFLANTDGVWILQEKLAMDPEFEKEWEHMMLDNR